MLHASLPHPTLVAHADWGSHPRKRWLALARRGDDGHYHAQTPQLAGEPETLLARLQAMAGPQASVLIGFDVPFGLPERYAALAGITEYRTLLPQLGTGIWATFYDVAEKPEEISLHRPFYPRRPGNTRQHELITALGVASIDELRRRCDRAHAERRAGSPLFWTLGAQQVGKAAISVWRDLLGPAFRAGIELAIWPFDGPLFECFQPGQIVITETYPGECYKHLGVMLGRSAGESRWGKRFPPARAANALTLLSWAADAGVVLEPALRAMIQGGFGPTADGEDPFDTTVGLFGTLNVALGRRLPGEPHPDDHIVRHIEGWILGQTHSI